MVRRISRSWASVSLTAVGPWALMMVSTSAMLIGSPLTTAAGLAAGPGPGPAIGLPGREHRHACQDSQPHHSRRHPNLLLCRFYRNPGPVCGRLIAVRLAQGEGNLRKQSACQKRLPAMADGTPRCYHETRTARGSKAGRIGWSDGRKRAGDLDDAERRAVARTVRGGHLPRQRARRAEAQQDQLGGAAAPPAERPDRHRRGEPVAAREPRPGACGGCGRPST